MVQSLCPVESSALWSDFFFWKREMTSKCNLSVQWSSMFGCEQISWKFAGFWIKFMEERNDESMYHFNLQRSSICSCEHAYWIVILRFCVHKTMMAGSTKKNYTNLKKLNCYNMISIIVVWAVIRSWTTFCLSFWHYVNWRVKSSPSEKTTKAKWIVDCRLNVKGCLVL